MCTVTLFRDDHCTIVTMNRDELRSRPEGAFCQASTLSGLDYLHPVDTLSQGTWLGINARGIGACLLNRYGASRLSNSHKKISRGSIIPALLQSHTLVQAYCKLDQLTLKQFESFEILLFNDETVLKCTHHVGSCSVEIAHSNRLMLTSSSWNKENVIKFRQTRFNDYLANMVDTQQCAESVLTDFHFNSTGDSRFDVLMRRPESHTKSISQIILDHQRISFRYFNEATLEALPSRSMQESSEISGEVYTLTRL